MPSMPHENPPQMLSGDWLMFETVPSHLLFQNPVPHLPGQLSSEWSLSNVLNLLSAKYPSASPSPTDPLSNVNDVEYRSFSEDTTISLYIAINFYKTEKNHNSAGERLTLNSSIVYA